jgi:hypothetical protein
LYLVFSSALAVTRDTEHLFNARALKISDTDLRKKEKIQSLKGSNT